MKRFIKQSEIYTQLLFFSVFGMGLAVLAIFVLSSKRDAVVTSQSPLLPANAGVAETEVAPEFSAPPLAHDARGQAGKPENGNLRSATVMAPLAAKSEPSAAVETVVQLPALDTVDTLSFVSQPTASSQPNKTETPSATDVQFMPACWILATNLPDNYYAISREREHVWSGASSARYYSTSELAQHGSLLQSVDAASFAGGRVELSAFIKTEQTASGIKMWFFAINSQGAYVANQRMDWIQGTRGWHSNVLVVDVPDSAAAIGFGFSMLGQGTLWVDDVRVVAVSSDVALTTWPNALGGGLPAPQLASFPPAPRNLDFETWVRSPTSFGGEICTAAKAE